MPAPMPQPRVYTLKQAEALTTFTRTTWYRWEKRGFIRLVRTANKTLIPAEEIDRVIAGEAVLHARGLAKPTTTKAASPGSAVQGRASARRQLGPPEAPVWSVAAKAEPAAEDRAGESFPVGGGATKPSSLSGSKQTFRDHPQKRGHKNDQRQSASESADQ
jgi:hypothetical protein